MKVLKFLSKTYAKAVKIVKAIVDFLRPTPPMPEPVIRSLVKQGINEAKAEEVKPVERTTIEEIFARLDREREAQSEEVATEPNEDASWESNEYQSEEYLRESENTNEQS